MARLQGISLNAQSPGDGQYLKYIAAANNWQSIYANVFDLKNASGLPQIPNNCTASQTLTYSALTDQFSCAAITVAASSITGLGTAAFQNVGVAPGNVVQLDTSAKIPPLNGSQLTGFLPSQIPGLDWSKIVSGTPTTLAGYGITNAVVNAGGAPSVQEGLDGAQPPAGTTGRIYFATNTKLIYRDNGTSWDQMSPAAAVNIAVTAPITNAGSGGNPVIGITAATTANPGSVQLAADGQSAAGLVVQASDSRLINSRPPSGPAGGDLAGSYPSPLVARLQGISLNAQSPGDGQYLKYIAAANNWQSIYANVFDLKNASGLPQIPNNCTASQTLTYSALTDQFSCAAITVAASSITGLGTAAFKTSASLREMSSSSIRRLKFPRSMVRSSPASCRPRFRVSIGVRLYPELPRRWPATASRTPS